MELKLQVLRAEAKLFRRKNTRVWERLLVLAELTKVRQQRVCKSDAEYEWVASKFDVSGRTLRRWERAYFQGGARSLVPGKAPGRKAQAIRGHTARKIRQWRTLYGWGAEVIQAHLKHDFEINLSRHRINVYLRKKGFLKERIKYKSKKKHTRIVQVEIPGAHTQVDVKHLPRLLANLKKCYVYNFVDHASKWAFKRAYDSYGPGESKDFMRQVVQAAPFKITRSQFDNGVEFTNKYLSHRDDPRPHALELYCASQGIRHVLIPPGEKELQGLVERSHRQDDEELYHRIKPRDLAHFNEILSQHCGWRNSKRRRKALDWKSSDEFLKEHQQKIETWLYKNGPSPFGLENSTEGENNEINTDLESKKVA